jgi:hypothetical protein
MLELAEQMLEAVAFAHRHHVMHCDVKPENFILFAGNRLRLADFGIARVAMRTLSGSGSGTVGYLAPEQALGKPSFRSDVFSLGLILYRMFSGKLPQWPFNWPPPGFDRVRKGCHPDLIAIMRRAMELDNRKRFADAGQMLSAFRRIKPRAQRATRSPRRRKARNEGRDWRTIRHREFSRQYRTQLETRAKCTRCAGPIAETMLFCPWCRTAVRPAKLTTRFPKRCRRCKRGIKTDWRFCPWCYGAAINDEGEHRYTDARYDGKCSNPACSGKHLMPFMRYCPWCRHKVRKIWKIEGSKNRCPRCRWGVVPEYWDYCPWCGRTLGKR